MYAKVTWLSFSLGTIRERILIPGYEKKVCSNPKNDLSKVTVVRLRACSAQTDPITEMALVPRIMSHSYE